MRTLLAILLAVLSPTLASAAPRFVDTLAARGGLGVPMARARQLEAHLGQLLVINVDGFGYAGTLALSPGYASLVEGLQVGGVIPHYGSSDYERIARTDRALAGLTEVPLLISNDIVKLAGPGGLFSFGDGYVGGFLGKYRRLPDAQLEVLARLNAFVLASIGVNLALGPTVDTSTGEQRVVERARIVIGELSRYGIAAVLKHFPSLPAAANLHRESPDIRLRVREIDARASALRALAPDAGIMMTTHFFDSLVDRSIATLSPRWHELLGSLTGFHGLVMSDGLLMLSNYADRSGLAGGPGPSDSSGVNGTALLAIRAILAGHDMVIVEGSAAQTTAVFDGILTVACAGTSLGKALAARIEESYGRIIQWKRERTGILRRAVDVPAAVVQSVMAILPADETDLGSFRFDAAALARLGPALSGAEADRRVRVYP